MAAEATAHAPLAPPSGCASPLRHASDGDSTLQLLQRPFTASGARKTRLLAVLVHWGEHLDSLVPEDLEDDGNGPEQLNTDKGEEVQLNSYELRSSPFATSRVVERSADPMWNELLLVSLPIDWGQQKDAAAWALHVDVVRRDPSQQEDALLASVSLPLQAQAMRRVPHHFAIELAPPTTQPSPRLYLSLTNADGLDDSDEVLEILVQELHEAAPSDLQETRPAAMVVLATAPMDMSLDGRDLFKTIGMDSSTVPAPDRHVWITPTAKEKHVDGATQKQFQWQFPAIISHFNSDDSCLSVIQAYAFVYSVVVSGGSYALQCVATSTLALDTAPLNGTATRLNPSLSFLNESTGSAGLLATVRRWDKLAWEVFHRTSVNRRVITTNRRHRKRMALQALEWTGAMCRGLNRYPISSFCDEGGLSGLLASYLATTSSQHGGAVGVDTVDTVASTRQAEDLLNHHIILLQQEVMAKQETISQLQRDADAHATALRKCGLELVAARKEVHARDEQITQQQAKLQEAKQRDAQQTRELLAATDGMTGLRLDSHGAQRLNRLIFKYKELEERYVATEAELVEAKRAVTALELSERKYAELEHAHVVQAALLQRLQRDKAQHGELQRTIQMQEKVIRKLENAVAVQQLPLASTPNPTTNGAAQHQHTPSERDSPHLAIRVQVLEQQLEANAKAAATEIGRLKMRVLELETQLSMDSANSTGMSSKGRPDQ